VVDVFAVRPAAAADVAQLAELEARARAALADVRGGAQVLAEEPAVGDWAQLLGRSDREVLVASIDDVVVGYLELHHHPGAAARIRQVFVEPGAREVGFGDDLVAAALASVAARGATAVESWALPGDRETKNLFERAGLTARKLVVAKRLEP